MKKILLNCTPPFMTRMPIAGLSSLKAFMQYQGIETDILYWNIRLEKTLKRFCNFGDMINESFQYRLLPFQAIYALQKEDKKALKRIRYFVLQIKPHYRNKGYDFIDRYIRASAEHLVKEIDFYIESLHLEKYALAGFPCHFHQMVPATYIAEKIKQRYPNIPIVVGGLFNKEHAHSMMNSFNLIDFAIYGEGEYALSDLYNVLEHKNDDFSHISKLLYRDGGEIKGGLYGKGRFLDFQEQIFPDYSDFIEEIGKPKAEHTLPLEGSRGCSWCRCHFCFLSTGYLPRAKKVDTLMNEIDYQVKATGIKKFHFSDADLFGIMGKDRLNEFLDRLIAYKNQNVQELTLIDIEVITREATFEIIKKIGILNVQQVHIGYESPSNELLKKIEKKNSFASNFFFNKWAHHFGISSIPFQSILSMLEETTDDVHESIDNLYFYRFMLDDNNWKHSYSNLVINAMSPYYKMIKQGKYSPALKNDSMEAYFLPEGIVKKEDEKNLFLWSLEYENPEWEKFRAIEEFYIHNKFKYKLLDGGAYVVYREMVNENQVQSLELSKKSISYKILQFADKQVVSLNAIAEELAYKPQQLDSLKAKIDELRNMGLIYASYDYTEIITVIVFDI